MIEKVVLENVRGINTEVELGDKTLIVGPNGSGKSAIVAGMNFAVLGYLPGAKVSETFANASGDTMAASVSIDGHSIKRTLTAGKTMRERISVDGGTEADRKAAAPMLELIAGKGPVLMDMPAFWAMTGTEKRRTLLAMVCDGDKLDGLVNDEKDAREKKNELGKSRRTAEATVKQLMESMSEIEKPTGNVESLKVQLTEAEKDLSDCMDQIRTGEANERAKAQVDGQVAGIAELKKRIAAGKAKEKKQSAKVNKLIEERDSMVEPEKPVASTEISEHAKEVIESATSEIYDWSEEGGMNGHTVEAEPLFEALKKLDALVAGPDERVEEEHMKWVEDVGDASAYITQEDGNLQEITKLLTTLNAQLSAAKKAEKQIDKIGDGVDEKIASAKEGLEKRVREIKEKLNPLERLGTLKAEVEKANIIADEAIQKEDEAGKTLQICIDAQQAVVQAASEQLSELSKEVLREGHLILEDDGKNDVAIYWEREGGLKVRRHTLSGGEVAIFDAAVGHAMAPGASIVIEAAEVDDKHLCNAMGKFVNNKKLPQLIILTCHDPFDGDEIDEKGEGWKVIRIGGAE